MLQRRWSKKVQLPVGPLWGKSGHGGVAGCMTWGYETPRDHKPSAAEINARILQKIKEEKEAEKSVQIDADLEKLCSSRLDGDLKIRPADSSRKNTQRNVNVADRNFQEDIAIDAVRSYAKKEHQGISDGVTSTRPPINYTSRESGRESCRTKPKKVDFQSSSRCGTQRDSARMTTPKPAPEVFDEWQDVNGILTPNKELRSTYLRPDSAFNYTKTNPDYFEMWKDSMKPKKETNRNKEQYVMSKYRKSAKPKIDCHWEKDPILRPQSKADSRVKVKFDCPDDSDMVVSVRVQKKEPFFH